MISRRLFLGGLAAGIAAPAIVHPGVLMPINPRLVPSPSLWAQVIENNGTQFMAYRCIGSIAPNVKWEVLKDGTWVPCRTPAEYIASHYGIVGETPFIRPKIEEHWKHG